MKDGTPRWLQHHYETCCKKSGHRKRWAYMIWRWFHHRDIISGHMDLHMTSMDNRAGLIIGSTNQACFVYIGL